MTDELIKLVGTDQHNIALIFRDYLISQQINAKVEQQGGHFIVYCQADKVDEAEMLFKAFAKEPFHPKYQVNAWQSSQQENVVSTGPGLLSDFKSKFLAHAGVVTISIFALCWIPFLLAFFGIEQPYYFLIFYQNMNLESFIANPLKLIGPAFVHFGWLHIVFNTMWWWQLGGVIEQRFGKGFLLNLFLVSAILSNVGQYVAMQGLQGYGVFGGLSGVVYALFGFIWILGVIAPHKGLGLPKNLVIFMLGWLLFGYLDILPIKFANTAHLIGLLSGCFMAWFACQFNDKQTK